MDKMEQAVDTDAADAVAVAADAVAAGFEAVASGVVVLLGSATTRGYRDPQCPPSSRSAMEEGNRLLYIICIYIYKKEE